MPGLKNRTFRIGVPPGAVSARGREPRRLPQRGRVGADPAAEEGEAGSFGGVEAESGHGEGGVEGAEEALGVVDMAAGDYHRHWV